MTFQAANKIYENGVERGFSAVQGTGFYVPKDFGIETRSCSTGCWRGYIMEYEIKNNQIFIKQFLFRPIDGLIPPVINDIKPIKYTKENRHPLSMMGFNHEYIDLNYKMPFTGTLWLCRNPKGSMYVPLDPKDFEFYGVKIPPQFWDFKYEFKDGAVINKETNSIQTPEIPPDPTSDEILDEMKSELERLKNLKK
jgi:hypothetical protein